MAHECKNEEASEYILFMFLAPVSFAFWVFIGVLYLCDNKLSLPPGKLVSAQILSYMLGLVNCVAYWPMLEE
jgi:hypothetical protein